MGAPSKQLAGRLPIGPAFEWGRALGMAVPAGILAALIALGSAAIHPLAPVLVVLALLLVVVAALQPMVTLYLAILAFPLEAVSLDLGALGVTPGEGLLILTAGGWAARQSAAGRPVFARSGLTAPFALSVAVIAVGVLVSETPFAVCKALAMWSAYFLIIQMILIEGNRRTVQNVLIAVAFAGAAFGGVAIATSGGQEVVEFGRTAFGRARAGFGSPNRLGEFLALALPCQIVLMLVGPVRLRWLMLLCAAVTGAGLALTLSRAAILGVAAGLLLLLAWKPFRRVFAVVLIALIGVTAVGANPAGLTPQLDVLSERVTSVRYEAELNPRRFTLERTPPLIADHPLLGVGANSLESVAAQYRLTLQGLPLTNAHNVFLHTAAERGLLGLAAFLWLLGAFAIVLVRACRRSAGRSRAYAYAIAAAWLSLLVEGMLDNVLEQAAIAGTAFVLMAAAAVLERESRSRSEPGVRTG